MGKLLITGFIAMMSCLCAAASSIVDVGCPECRSSLRQCRDDVPVSWFAFCEWPDADVIGVRVGIPYATSQGSVHGVDFGLWGQCQDFRGLGFNLFRNDASGTFSGLQIGVYNSCNHGLAMSVQVGLLNDSFCLHGIQAGVVNVSGRCSGIQIGLINVTERMYGFQIGLINAISNSSVPFFPIINMSY